MREARSSFDVSAALVFLVDQRGRRAAVVAGDPQPAHRDWFGLDDASPLAEALVSGSPVRLSTAQARELALASGLQPRPQAALVAPLPHPGGALAHALLIADDRPRSFEPQELDAAAAIAESARASLAQFQLAEEHGAQLARQSAVARAAKALNESLDLTRVLPRICEEAGGILGAEHVLVFRGTTGKPLQPEASSTTPERGVGVEHGGGISARALELGRPIISNDYIRDAAPVVGSEFAETRSAVAVPMRWDGELRGVMWAGFAHDRLVLDEDAQLLESFAELAAVACRNAGVHADLAEAARTDALTGCMNHAALHETLRREMQRSRRTGRPLTVVLIDLDHFKQVNERQGHLAGDEVLRRVGRALRQAVRPYDFVARYGGDEFAIVSVDSEEELGAEIARRAVQRLSEAIAELGHDKATTYATAGVAEWDASVTPAELLRATDRALLYGKQRGVRGAAILASSVPEAFRLGRPDERDEEAPPPALEPLPGPVALDAEPLRKRNRQLTLANALGARLAEMTSVDEVAAAVVDELHRAFGYFTCAVLRPTDADTLEAMAGRGAAYEQLGSDWQQPRSAGIIGRCLRERRTLVVNEVQSDPDYFAAETTEAVRSELAAPIWVGSELWGVLDVQEAAADAFDDADARLLETVADQLGAALRSATLYEQLERAYIGTAEALAAALEAKDAHTGNHARAMVRNAEAVARALGLSGPDLRDVTYGAAFHDIGKIAVPEAILNKPGPLTTEERAEVERHVLVGEQILAPVDFLAGVRSLVRHGHERWDGTGYPDRLVGEDIPLGSRIILACDAHDAMTSDRPYRKAIPEAEARAELRRFAGAQFDSRIVDVLIDVLDTGTGGGE